VSRGAPVTVEDCARYVGQPAQYAVGRGSQLSVLVVLDHGRKTAPPGVLENYIAWLQPRLHGLHDPRYPSLVGVLIVNTNLPIPSAWSRRRIKVEADREPASRPETGTLRAAKQRLGVGRDDGGRLGRRGRRGGPRTRGPGRA
jgi:hypothetical protein